MSYAYAKAITLPVSELPKYHKVTNSVLHVWDFPSELNTVFKSFIESDEYSINLKRKIIFEMPSKEPARKWGLRNFAGEDLYQFISILSFRPIYSIIEDDMVLLAKNPHFVSSLGHKTYDSFTHFLVEVTGKFNDNIVAKNALTVQLAAENVLTLQIAQQIILLNNLVTAIGIGPNYATVNEEPLLAWVRETYNLSNVPDSWLRKIVTPTSDFAGMSSLISANF